MNPKTKPNFLRQTLAAGLILPLRAPRRRIPAAAVSLRPTDTRDYTLTVASAHALPGGRDSCLRLAGLRHRLECGGVRQLPQHRLGRQRLRARHGRHQQHRRDRADRGDLVNYLAGAWIPRPPGITSPPTATGQVGWGLLIPSLPAISLRGFGRPVCRPV